VDRIVEDYVNPATKPYAPVVIVGCQNVSFHKPAGGESPLHIIALPGLSRIEENRASENQIGVTLLRLTKDGNLFVKSHNLNDLVVRERETINISPQYNKLEKKVLGEFRHKTWWTVGLLAEKLGMARDDVARTLNSITQKTRLNPPLQYDEFSQRFYIPRPWIQQNLTYPYPWPEKQFTEERFISFGCLHALCRHTAHRFMLDEVPQLMLKYDIRHLIGGGDFIEGRAHGLPENGELLFGASYDQQEKFAAWLTATAMLKPFKIRFVKAIQNADKKLFTNEVAVLNFVKLTLPDFWYISGNHDEWTEKAAFAALTVFRYELLNLLRHGVVETLRDSGLVVPSLLEEFLEANAVRMNPLDAKMHPSGLSLSLNHLHMARAQTKTLRSQALLGATEADVNIHANFHTALSMSRFDPTMGQRVIQQIGTLKIRSGFEDRKGKKVDFGVGYLRVGLVRRGDKNMILMHEVAFFGDPSKYQSIDNKEFIDDFKKEIEKASKFEKASK
ncbi:MAG: hypothetical protein Q8R36_01000, partial [bacterium]|nr:hypothetical protein [bacterium]